MTKLELLAPARNIDIGIAAIDCGADAVYIAGPEFGARKAAGNTFGDIAKLCHYAHEFGVRIFITLNTILYDKELEKAKEFIAQAEEAGADALIVQDPAITEFNMGIPIHASTQCSIRTPETAVFLESLGFSRLILERELPLEQIKDIRKAVKCDLEFFVHGALCVCYSGQCYMSEYLSGRSANRGECIQACRSLYDLEDSSGRKLARNKALLSLKDLNLKKRLYDLAETGITSFKIEGRLKNISYVRNTVMDYSSALDDIIEMYPDRYERVSYGHHEEDFVPDPEKTFNRGYTELFIDGKRSKWASIDAAKSMGEFVGTVCSVKQIGEKDSFGREIIITVTPVPGKAVFKNGDGFSFISGNSVITGFRGDICNKNEIRCKAIRGLAKGTKLYRNISMEFEKELEKACKSREIEVKTYVTITEEKSRKTVTVSAISEDGRKVTRTFDAGDVTADNRERMASLLESQMSKHYRHYSFLLVNTNCECGFPLMSAASINSIRRTIGEELDKLPCGMTPLPHGKKEPGVIFHRQLFYNANISNKVTEGIYKARGFRIIEKAYELGHKEGAELMRTKYCIRYELGFCPKYQGSKESGPLFLVNNGKKFKLGFNCSTCEMTVSACPEVK
ncbi:MAG: U32 family peptidase [Bacteroidales bacterium]|jgi:putative protease|nr:U32 family peptidase [Bacteroidales bacterium]MCI1784951.1 U32 family peptidase [Bacteroidales bacterium]